MTLRPEMAEFLAAAARAEAPELRFLGVERARRSLHDTALEWWGTPDPVAEVTDRDLVTQGPGEPTRVRMYRPTPAATRAVVFLHGGGWVIGDLDTHDGLCRALALATGRVVVSVDYRLAPEHPFPAAVDDCVDATAAVLSAAADLGVAPDDLVLVGESAGATLAAVVAQVLAERGAGGVAAQVLIYPVTDLLAEPATMPNRTGHLLTADDLDWYYRLYAPPERWGDVRISPLAGRPHPDTPRTLLITAEFDPLRPQGAAYAAALAAAGVDVVHEDIDGVIHGFALMRAISPATADLIDRIANFVGPDRS